MKKYYACMSNALITAAVIGTGGAAGAIARYAVTGPVMGPFIDKIVVDAAHPRFPWGVLTVNLVGCLLIGIVAAALVGRPADDRLRFLLVTGFLGSFTTFSAFGLDTFELLKGDAFALAITNILASVLGGTALAAAGWIVTQKMLSP